MGRSQIRGGQIKDDTVTGDDVDESTLIITHLEDLDNDTKVQVEKTGDEDKIRFDTGGVERMIIQDDGKVGIGDNITPGYKLDVDGDVRIRGGDIRDNSGGKVIEMDGNGFLKFTNGQKYAKGVLVSSVSSPQGDGVSTQDGGWIKFATFSCPGSSGLDTAASTFLITIAGMESSNNRVLDGTFIVSAKFTNNNAGIGTDNASVSNAYYEPEGTYLYCEPLNAERLSASGVDDFDPSTDLLMIFPNNTTTPDVDLYMRACSKTKRFFATHLGGTGQTDTFDTDIGWTINTGQTWSSTEPVAPANHVKITGSWASKVFSHLDVYGDANCARLGIMMASTTPSQPPAEEGYIYSKSDGKLYWRSHDINEVDLTAVGGVMDADGDTYIDPEESADDDTLRFYASGGEKMKITDAGVTVLDKIAIGTTPSTLTFDLKSNIGGTVARISNNQVSGPTLMMLRDSEASNQNDVDSGEGIGTLQFNAGGNTWSQPTAKILVEASQNWSLAGSDYGSRMELFTTKTNSSQQTQRLILNDNVQVKDDLYVDGDLYVSGSQDIAGAITSSSTIRSGTNYTNAIISNNQMGVSNARYLLSYTETGSDRVIVNSNSQNLDFEVKDDAGNSMIYMDAGTSRVNLGCPDGQPFASCLDDHMDSASTGVYIEGASNESVCTIAQTTRSNSNTSADVLALIGGNGVEVTTVFTAGFFYDNVDTYYGGLPDSDNKFVSCWYKQHPTGNDRTDTLPSSIEYCGGIMGDGSGGIAIDYSFTGTHDVCSSEETIQGLIVESTGELWLSHGMDTSLPYVRKSTASNSKTVFGVVSKTEITSGRRMFVGTKFGLVVNSVGEGKVWVTNFEGEPSNGDYITSSPIAGYGKLQSDDILHSYTVAKLTEVIDWSSVNDTIEHDGVQYKKYLVGCTYHCG